MVAIGLFERIATEPTTLIFVVAAQAQGDQDYSVCGSLQALSRFICRLPSRERFSGLTH
jgi:hypothetical protein